MVCFVFVPRVLDWEQLMALRTLQVLIFAVLLFLSVMMLKFSDLYQIDISVKGYPEASNGLQCMLWDEVVVCIVLGSHQIWEITIQSTVFLTAVPYQLDLFILL